MSLSRIRGGFWLFLVELFCFSSLIVLSAQEESTTHPTEVTALQSVRRKLKDPKNNLSDWKKGDPCAANWTGVVCFNSTLDDGYLHVRDLELLNLNLSGSLSPELGRLSYMKILDFMWNNISGSIPKEIGNASSLELLLLNGNQLTGSLPEEIGYLSNLDRIQVDQNQISGPIPKSFANLNKIMHFHFNNNSISGQIPPELSRLPNLIHFLVDNNNLSGYLPPELSEIPRLRILQLDNNHFDGSIIPASYANMSNLLKLSLRNCSLQGPLPDFSRIPDLAYIDLSSNQLNGSIPSDTLSNSITTIDLSNNKLTGTIPDNIAGLPRLQILALANNSLNGSVSSTIWLKRILNATEILILDLQNNRLSNVTGSLDLPANVSVSLQGNPLCSNANLILFCGSPTQNDDRNQGSTNSTTSDCPKCPTPFEHSRESNVSCFCAAPLLVGYRLKSPGFSDFLPYRDMFEVYLTSGLKLYLYQLDIDSFRWLKGPRLGMYLKIFPVYDALSDNPNIFNRSEVQRIRSLFTGWTIPDSELFGPYELLNFTLLDPYKDAAVSPKSGISNGALAGIVLGAIAGAITLSALVSLFILRKRNAVSRRRPPSKVSFIIDGVKGFTFEEMAMAANNFDSSSQVGEGGYGKVFKGSLADGSVVAVKRAQRNSLQGEKEFLTEIELLSRLHHRNLVPLIGYCDEEAEQMLVYEFMSNGTLRDHLFVKSKDPLSFAMRLKIALGSAKGVLYLHTEADPPIFHRDIKSSNILLDSKFIAKVADFGLSRLAPAPDFEGTVPAHISTVVKGTPGYIDPEYFLTHQLTDKSDVYSLGVVFLELLTGMHAISEGKNIVREVKIAYQSGMIFSLIDNRMESYPSECVERFANLAIKCCQDDTDARPSMEEVVQELENIWRMMPESKTKTNCNDNRSSVENYGGEEYNPSSSSSSFMAKQHPFMSLDVSGSDLVSGDIPNITPR